VITATVKGDTGAWDIVYPLCFMGLTKLLDVLLPPFGVHVVHHGIQSASHFFLIRFYYNVILSI
jgi:hypothetical protein